MLCDDPEGWVGEVGRMRKREGIYVYLELIPVVVQQNLTQHCKALSSSLQKENTSQ